MTAPAPRIRIDPASGTPAVRQIVDSLRVLLVDGELTPGTSLPSVRRLAIELGVHFNTVAEAYRQLALEGWLESKRGRGAIVVPRARAIPTPGRIADFRSRLRSLIAEMRSEGVANNKIAAELRAAVEVLTRS